MVCYTERSGKAPLGTGLTKGWELSIALESRLDEHRLTPANQINTRRALPPAEPLKWNTNSPNPVEIRANTCPPSRKGLQRRLPSVKSLQFWCNGWAVALCSKRRACRTGLRDYAILRTRLSIERCVVSCQYAGWCRDTAGSSTQEPQQPVPKKLDCYCMKLILILKTHVTGP